MKTLLVLVFFAFVLIESSEAQRATSDIGVSQSYVLSKVNKLRKKGCRCGKKYYQPAGSLTWNKTLEVTAYNHSRHMFKYNLFSHKSIHGEDVGDRFDAAGYKWQYAGENLASGQKSFDEALKDWIKSPTHCKMLMNPNMKELGVARYGKYWVQHFGKVMPAKTRRRNVTYSEG